MIFLLVSIILSSLIFVCFKWFDMKQVKLPAAITGNYVGCILTGFILNYFSGSTGNAAGTFEVPFAATCLLLGILFFIVFYGMGYASAHIGVGITGASTKMSLIIPVMYVTVVLHEPFGLTRILALLFALLAVLLMSWSPAEHLSLKKLLIPFLVFTGSGIVDTAIKLVSAEAGARELDHSLTVTFIFTGALCTSLLFMLFRNRQLLKDIRSLTYGFLLGIPNYFSIYAMVRALDSGDFSANSFYMLNNTSIMILCFLLALLLFGEKLSRHKVAGIVLAILAIYLVLYR